MIVTAIICYGSS
ncbi:Protein of unknown function [Lactobacillus delbrueckii subsp. lactis]|nr:Protein of unknown function [Lactobacillus delbrueckii subsp. lactis]